MSINVNREMVRGDDNRLRFKARLPDNSFKDWSGGSAKFTVKKLLRDTVKLIEKDSGSPSEIIINVDEIDVFINQADTLSLAGNYVYDLEAIDGLGKKKTVVGELLIKIDVTTP